MRRPALLAATAALASGLLWPAAAAAVGPSPGVVFGGDGAAWQGHPQRFVTTPRGAGTAISELRRAGGQVVRSRTISARFGIPAVTYYDGSVELVPVKSATLVLATNPHAQLPRRTRFVVLSTRDLHVLRRLDLRGAFAFDALSPDGMTIYLIQHTSASSITRYVVRAYDLRRGRLVPGVIADESTGEWKIDGLPVTRLQSGVWAYTLYGNGDREGPFVHALDTRTGTAHCIDLPRLRIADAGAVRLHLAGGRLLAVEGGRTLAAIDLSRFREVAHPRAPQSASEASSDMPPTVLAVVAVALAAAGAAGVRRARRRPR